MYRDGALEGRALRDHGRRDGARERRVTLRGPEGNDAYGTVDRAPTARDLAGKGREHWLDLPGDAISPRCSYLEFFERAAKGRPAVAYTHVATQPDRPGKLALQY